MQCSDNGTIQLSLWIEVIHYTLRYWEGSRGSHTGICEVYLHVTALDSSTSISNIRAYIWVGVNPITSLVFLSMLVSPKCMFSNRKTYCVSFFINIYKYVVLFRMKISNSSQLSGVYHIDVFWCLGQGKRRPLSFMQGIAKIYCFFYSSSNDHWVLVLLNGLNVQAGW